MSLSKYNTTTKELEPIAGGFDVQGILDDIGDLTDLDTSTKTDLVSAVNEVKGDIPTKTSDLTNNSGFVGLGETASTAYAGDKGKSNADAIEAIVNVNAGCNLLPCSASSQTIEGITWTVNSDGTVTASGTATANGSILTYHRFTSECVLNGKEVILKGCPVGGGASSYSIAGFRVAGSSSYLDNREEYGEGVRFTWNNDSSQVVPEIQLAISPNYAIQGTLTFKPMLYDARLNPTGYVPYSMTNRELTDAVSGTTDFISLIHANISITKANALNFGDITIARVAFTVSAEIQAYTTLFKIFTKTYSGYINDFNDNSLFLNAGSGMVETHSTPCSAGDYVVVFIY